MSAYPKSGDACTYGAHTDLVFSGVRHETLGGLYTSWFLLEGHGLKVYVPLYRGIPFDWRSMLA